MSLARRTQERILAMKAASAPASGSGHTRPAATMSPVAAGTTPTPVPTREGSTAESRLAAQMKLRLVHDLRRLKEIKSTELKIAAKRQMLPEYRAWFDGWLEAGRCTNGNELGSTGADDVLPTIMVWLIDTGDWAHALDVAEHVLRFRIAMPDRYKRDAATLVVEEVAEAAIRAQASSQVFPLDVLEKVELLTIGTDMHDEVQAKLQKALGVELARAAGEIDTGPADFIAAATRALGVLRRAQELNPRAGIKTRVTQLEKAIKGAGSLLPAQVSAGDLSLSNGVGGSDAHPAGSPVNAAPLGTCPAKDGNDATQPEN